MSTSLARRAAIATLAMVLLVLSQAVALGAPADLDPGFGQNGRLTLDGEIARGVALQPDRRILVAGQVGGENATNQDGVVYRLNAGGSPDGTFGSGGAARLVAMDSGAYALAPRPDGKILAVGVTFSDGLVYRLDADGAPDETFGRGGAVPLDNRPQHVHLLPLGVFRTSQMLSNAVSVTGGFIMQGFIRQGLTAGVLAVAVVASIGPAAATALPPGDGPDGDPIERPTPTDTTTTPRQIESFDVSTDSVVATATLRYNGDPGAATVLWGDGTSTSRCPAGQEGPLHSGCLPNPFDSGSPSGTLVFKHRYTPPANGAPFTVAITGKLGAESQTLASA